MVFKFSVNGTVRANSIEDVTEKLKKEFDEDFFNKHISIGDEVEDKGQDVDIK